MACVGATSLQHGTGDFQNNHCPRAMSRRYTRDGDCQIEAATRRQKRAFGNIHKASGSLLAIVFSYFDIAVLVLVVFICDSMLSLRPVSWILSLALTVALAMYGLDCLGMITPEQAMQCCNRMHCHSHHHHPGQDCCKAPPQMHAALGPPSAVQGIFFSPVALDVVKAFSDTQVLECSVSVIAGNSHDPPLPCGTSLLALRI